MIPDSCAMDLCAAAGLVWPVCGELQILHEDRANRPRLAAL